MSNSAVTCASFNQEGTFVVVGRRNGFGVFACDPFAERYRRTFHRSERIRVPPHFIIAGSAAGGGGGAVGGPATELFAFTSVKMLHDTNLIALVGNGDPPSGAPSTELHYTHVFQKHKLIIWDIRVDSIFADIDLLPYVSGMCRGITNISLFRDGYRAAGALRPSTSPVDDLCDWPEDDEDAGKKESRAKLGSDKSPLPRQKSVSIGDQYNPTSTRILLPKVRSSGSDLTKSGVLPVRRLDDPSGFGSPTFKATMTFCRFLDKAAQQQSTVPSFDSMREVGSEVDFEIKEGDPMGDSVFKIQVQLITERSGTFAYCIKGSTTGENCEYHIYQVSHHSTGVNNRGLGTLRSVSFDSTVPPTSAPPKAAKDACCESSGLFMALPATSLGCIRAMYATGEAIAPQPSSCFIEAHGAQKNPLGCLAVATTSDTTNVRSAKPQRCFLVASTSSAAHSVHLYRVTIALDTSAPPALLHSVKLKELRRAYANNATLGNVGVVDHDTVACMAFSPSNTHLAVASTLGVVQIFAVSADNTLYTTSSAVQADTDGDKSSTNVTEEPQAMSTEEDASSGLSAWGTWLGGALVSGAKSIVAATKKVVDHESPILTLDHPSLRADAEKDLGPVVDIAFSTEAPTPLLHVATSTGMMASFALDLTSAPPQGALLHEPHHVE